ncbi:MFS transporter [Streptomyces sp. NPDC056817]|uniref:MFS transporter n=1 Tax=Streptomyces sp. NPDC056817 TaxID=3345950 RepID=UPI0036ADA8C0
MGIGTVLVAVNLRAAITSLGAILDRVSTDLDLSGAEAGLLTTLPVVAFAAVGGLSPLLARRLGLFGGLVVACVALVIGLAARAAAHSGGVMLAWSGLALAGIAVANVLLPVVVKSFFPHRLGLMTGLYTMAMQLGSATAAGTTPLVAEAGGGWRSGLSLWALVAACAVPPWLLALRGSARPAPASRRRSANGLARNPLAWALAGFFGVQSLAAYVVMGWVPAIYRSAGVSSAMSGVLLAVIMALAAPIALLLPTLANRLADQRVLVLIVTMAMAFGWLGLMIAPVEGAWWWAVLLGIGSGAFPLALTLIGLRARSTEATADLSAFAQSAGYMMAMVGPFAVGTMHEVTGSWSLPLGVLIVLLVPQLIAGLAAGRNRFVDGGNPTGA